MLARHLALSRRLGVPVVHHLGGRRLARLHRVDGLEHGSGLGALGLCDLGKDVAVEMHRAALVFGLRERIGD